MCPSGIINILNFYIIILGTNLYHFFLVSIYYLQCIHCLLRRRRKNNDVGESLANKLVCRKNENLGRNQHTRDYCTQYTGGWNFFVPDFNILSYSLRLQGDNQLSTIYQGVHITYFKCIFGLDFKQWLKNTATVSVFKCPLKIPIQ